MSRVTIQDSMVERQAERLTCFIYPTRVESWLHRLVGVSYHWSEVVRRRKLRRALELVGDTADVIHVRLRHARVEYRLARKRAQRQRGWN